MIARRGTRGEGGYPAGGWSPPRQLAPARVPSPRASRSQVVIDDSPYVTPLVTAADLRDWLVVVLDSRHARFLHGSTDGLEELDGISHDVVGPTRRRGPSENERWVEHEVD